MMSDVVESLKKLSERMNCDLSSVILWVERGLLPELSECEALTDSEIDAFMYAFNESKTDISDKNNFIGAYRLFSGTGASVDRIEDVKSYLRELSCTDECIRKLYENSLKAFITSKDKVESFAKRLDYWGFSKSQTASVITDAILLPMKNMDGRIEAALDCLEAEDTTDNKELIEYIVANKFFFYAYYTDPEEAIWKISAKFGKKKAFIILKEHPEILYLWKAGDYKDDVGFKKQTQELYEILKSYIS